MKTCQHCGAELTFMQRKNCAKCSSNAKRERNRQWHIDNKEHRSEKDKINHKSPSYRWHLLKQNAKKRFLEVTITREQFEELSVRCCYYCEGFLDTDSGWGSHIDRLDNYLGYTYSNSVSCCDFCNRIKQDLLSPIEAKAAINTIIEIRDNSNARTKDSNSSNTKFGNTSLSETV